MHFKALITIDVQTKVILSDFTPVMFDFAAIAIHMHSKVLGIPVQAEC